MNLTGNLRKMRTSLDGSAQYDLRLFNGVEPSSETRINSWVGKEIQMKFTGNIHCVVTGKKIKKTFGEGMSFDAWRKSPMAVESIIRPELSQIHEGIALRDKEWEEEHHNKPHVVYLSQTSGIKVGVTRETNIPSRWIDQGAVQAIQLCDVPYRQLAGLIEVSLKDHMADKTNWRTMLKNEVDPSVSMLDVKDEVLEWLPEEYHDFISDNDEVTQIDYPVLNYPSKVNSIKLDKVPEFTKKLVGIKGQYFIFHDETVMNIRSHSAYEVEIKVSE